MPGPNINRIGQQGGAGRSKPVSAQEQLRLDKQNDVLKQLGLSDINQLPPEAAGTLKQTLTDNDKNLANLKAGPTAKLVQRSIARSVGKSFEARTQPNESIRVPADSKLFTKANKDGSFQLTGSLSQGPVSDLMKEIGIDAKSFGPDVQKALSGAQGADLGNAKNWSRFSKRLKESHLREQPVGQIGSVTNLGSSTATGGVAEASISQTAGLGLAKNARSVEDAQKLDASATPDAVMHNEAIRDPDASVLRAQTSAKVHQIMDRAGLTPDQQKEFAPFLDKALKEGQSTAKTETDKGWQIVKSAQRQITGKKMPTDKGKVEDTPEARDGVSLMAAGHLYNLAESKTGATLDRSEVRALQDVLTDFTSTGASKSSSKSSLGSGPSATESTKKTNSTSSKRNANAAKEAAHAQLEAMGIDPKDPLQSHVVKDVEGAFAQVMNGAKDDADIALRGIKWVERKVGDKSGAHSKHMEEVLKTLPKDSPLPEAFKQYSLQQVALCAGAGPEAYMQHLNQAMGAGGMMPGGAGGGVPPFGGTPVSGIPGGGLPPYGGGPAMPMGGGAPGAVYGSAEQQYSTNMRCLQCAMILNDPSLSMEDKIMYFLMVMAAGQDDDRMRKMREITDLEAKDAAKQQAKQMRVNQRAAQKLGQTPDAKSEQAASSDTQTETAKAAASTMSGSKPKAATETKSAAASASAANTAGAAPKAQTSTADGNIAGEPQTPAPGGKPAKGAAAAAQNKAAGKPTKEEAVQAQLEAENELQGSANPEAPKSKEILMMELKRITELRSMLMQMVNEILRKSNENVRNIWRG
ncbi:MAG: hypothetical protein VYC39_18240 [Myxococcota bacterium]|nr:hypothetical protein [Myxococcota bacterium]